MKFFGITVAVMFGFAAAACDRPHTPPPIEAVDDILERAVTDGRVPGVIAFAADANGVIYAGVAVAPSS